MLDRVERLDRRLGGRLDRVPARRSSGPPALGGGGAGRGRRVGQRPRSRPVSSSGVGSSRSTSSSRSMSSLGLVVETGAAGASSVAGGDGLLAGRRRREPGLGGRERRRRAPPTAARRRGGGSARRRRRLLPGDGLGGRRPRPRRPARGSRGRRAGSGGRRPRPRAASARPPRRPAGASDRGARGSRRREFPWLCDVRKTTARRRALYGSRASRLGSLLSPRGRRTLRDSPRRPIAVARPPVGARPGDHDAVLAAALGLVERRVGGARSARARRPPQPGSVASPRLAVTLTSLAVEQRHPLGLDPLADPLGDLERTRRGSVSGSATTNSSPP